MNHHIKKQNSLQSISKIGADFVTKEVNVEGNIVQLQIWNTAGAEKFHSREASCYRNSECCILVCDLTDPKSFESVESWRTLFLNKLNPKEPDTFPFVLLCNKCDKVTERKVQVSKIKQYCATKSNMLYFETSAKDNTNVEVAFEQIAKLILNRKSKEDKIFISNGVDLKRTNPQTQQNNYCLI